MTLRGAAVRELLGRGEMLKTDFARSVLAEISERVHRSGRYCALAVAPPETRKETKAQRVERLKRELNPWEHLEPSGIRS